VPQHPDITVRVIILVDPVALRSARYPSPLDFPVTTTVNGRRWWCITITGTGTANSIQNKGSTYDCRGNPQRVIGPVPPIAAIVSMAIVASAMAAITAVVSPSITSIAAAMMSVTSGINSGRH
jgi:hypothetical protein